jgi:hypothetical protein
MEKEYQNRKGKLEIEDKNQYLFFVWKGLSFKRKNGIEWFLYCLFNWNLLSANENKNGSLSLVFLHLIRLTELNKIR